MPVPDIYEYCVFALSDPDVPMLKVHSPLVKEDAKRKIGGDEEEVRSRLRSEFTLRYKLRSTSRQRFKKLDTNTINTCKLDTKVS